ncbi:unnamed protein product [Sphagnum balticum]
MEPAGMRKYQPPTTGVNCVEALHDTRGLLRLPRFTDTTSERTLSPSPSHACDETIGANCSVVVDLLRLPRAIFVDSTTSSTSISIRSTDFRSRCVYSSPLTAKFFFRLICFGLDPSSFLHRILIYACTTRFNCYPCTFLAAICPLLTFLFTIFSIRITSAFIYPALTTFTWLRQCLDFDLDLVESCARP